MLKKKNKKKKICLILCTILVCICSVFSFIPLSKNDKLQVQADEVVTTGTEFIGSSVFVPVDLYQISFSSAGVAGYPNHFVFNDMFNTSSGLPIFADVNMFLFSFNFSLNSSGDLLCSIPSIISDVDDGLPCIVTNGSVYTMGESFVFKDYIKRTVCFTSSLYGNYFVSNASLTKPFGLRAYLDMSASFDYTKIISVRLGAYGGVENSLNSFKILYSDINGGYLSISLYYQNYYSFSERTYYIKNLSEFTDNEYYNQGYSQGNSEGYNKGYSEGQSIGYEEGYKVGEVIGYNNGYTDGLEDSNDYSFLSLVSATIDAPVKYFQSLFNFELLGVNLQGFLTGLFTLCVIVTIVKLCLGG